MSTEALKNKVKRLQRDNEPGYMTIPVFSCTVDGKPTRMRYLDAVALELDGHTVAIGEQCGVEYEQKATPAQLRQNIAEVERLMDQILQEYNSPEEVAKRQAEEEELRRIGELRRQDFYAGRDMDKCHPLPWTTRRECET